MPRQSYDHLQSLLLELQQENASLSTDEEYNVTTHAAASFKLRRVAEDARWVLLVHVDRLSEWRHDFTHETVNGMIKRAVNIRAPEVLLRSRWIEPQQIVFVLSHNPDQLSAKLKTAFRNEGPKIVTAYTQYSGSLSRDVTACEGLVALALQRSQS